MNPDVPRGAGFVALSESYQRKEAEMSGTAPTIAADVAVTLNDNVARELLPWAA